jgi:O-phosphoseryl-tRNA(Cys) synthetase
MARYTKIELCEVCADDPTTLNNMQTLIIPLMNGEIFNAREIIKCAYKGEIKLADYDIISLFRKEIVDNMKAIRVFYKRFPELKRVYTYKLNNSSDRFKLSIRR